MTLFDLEKTSPFPVQADFARWATFNFNEELVNSLIPSLMDPSQIPLFMLIIRNKHLLSKKKEPIEAFLTKVDALVDRNEGEEVFKLFTKSGVHMLNAETLLTAEDRFVSKNEMDYVVRDHVFPMAIYNSEFSFMNEDLTTKAVACKARLLDEIQKKRDVASVTEDAVIMINGDVFKLIVIE